MRSTRVRNIMLGVAVMAPIFIICSILALFLNAPEEKIGTATSPDGRFVALVTASSSITSYKTFVRVRDHEYVSGSGGMFEKTLMAIDGRAISDDIRLTWQDERTLIVEYTAYARLDALNGEPWNGVDFVFRSFRR